MKYESITNHRSQHRVKKMCVVLKVNESGYYRWKRRKPSQRELEEALIEAMMQEIHEANNHTLGALRMQRELAKKGTICGLRKIRRLMRSNGMYTVYQSKRKPYPKEAGETTYRENLVNQQFNVTEPNCCWMGDITYIQSDRGWIYLAAVLDLINLEVIGYAINRKANSELTKRALEQALINRHRPKGLIFHSDRRTQYSSTAYQKYLADNYITSSMSRKGTLYNNAYCVSFFATMKKEWIFWRKFADEKAFESGAFAYIELFYNRKRMHSSLDYMSPCQYMKIFMATKAC
jgi:putative transposase